MGYIKLIICLVHSSIHSTIHSFIHLKKIQNLSSFFLSQGISKRGNMSEGPKKSKYSATRRLLLKTKLLKKGGCMLLAEIDDKIKERDSTLNERVPPLKLSGMSVQELQELCKDLHRKSDVVDDARYDLEVKVAKNEKEIETLTGKINEMKGTKNRTKLKRVKKTTDLGSMESKLMKADFKANLKTVKKEEEKKEEVTDWRKNVEAMSGMEGRKKLFNAQ
ncbi:troponin I, slow skeletal muscle-like [Clupea harengus]|uniref:Troponin I, slow skeletal muscle-like n=1 Tax=Clupea harengus TaxID=7950 RepID=A0A6P3VER7_CLUHA|nr:troponin I, slow skeletal muscle-like [Clupea harengus]